MTSGPFTVLLVREHTCYRPVLLLADLTRLTRLEAANAAHVLPPQNGTDSESDAPPVLSLRPASASATATSQASQRR